MKHTHKCPKCGSEDILWVEGQGGHNSVPCGIVKTARIDRWLCCTCGYSEEWVDEEALKDVKKHWSKRQEN